MIEPTRFEDHQSFLIAGLKEHYTTDTMNSIPKLWERFGPSIGSVPGQVDQKTYGVCFNNSTNGFDYLAGVEVSSSSGLPAEFDQLKVPAHKYAVFAHREHISTIRKTIDAVGKEWLPQSGYLADGPPAFFERYQNYDPQTGMGDIEIWFPIRK